MADIIRHGGGSHFMRPDRVIRTGVLSPMMGYQPQSDVESVAMMFTQGPRRGMMLQGPDDLGPLQRFGLRIKAWWAEKRAKRFMAINGLGMPGPMIMQAQQIAPHLASQMMGVMALTAGRVGGGYPATQADALIGRTLTNRYP
jgi:hypothetical protein